MKPDLWELVTEGDSEMAVPSILSSMGKPVEILPRGCDLPLIILSVVIIICLNCNMKMSEIRECGNNGDLG